jgi:hypothetical protein
MKNLRRLLLTAVAATVFSGIASADTVISYTVNLPSTVTDLNNVLLQLTAWNPGVVQSLSNVASDNTLPALISNGPTITGGITMQSLNANGVAYVLQSYDIFVSPTVSGTFSVTDTSGNVSGTANVTSYTAASLGSTMATLTSSSDPTNDLFYKNGNVPGNGANVNTNQIGVNLTTGQSTGNQPLTGGVIGADLGFSKQFNSTNNFYVPISTSVNSVKSSNALQFYLSSLTNVTTTLSGGSTSTAKSTSIAESITVFYDYTTSTATPTTPEPTTMVLFGSALVGLGLLRKRVRQS